MTKSNLLGVLVKEKRKAPTELIKGERR